MNELKMNEVTDRDIIEFELNELHQLACRAEEISGYAVDIRNAVSKFVDSFIGTVPECDEDMDAIKVPETIKERISCSHYVIDCSLKSICSDLKRL